MKVFAKVFLRFLRCHRNKRVMLSWVVLSNWGTEHSPLSSGGVWQLGRVGLRSPGGSGGFNITGNG